MKTRYLLALAIIALGGCTRHVDDLSFVSIDALHDSHQISNLRIRFSTATNLRKTTGDADADGIYARISLCPFHRNPMVSIGRVEHNGIDLETRPMRGCVTKRGEAEKCTMVDDTPAVRAEVASANDKGPFVYEVPFVYNGKQSEEYSDHGGTSWRDVAMPSGVRDWCVKMEGPAMFSGGLETNAFRIPKQAIAKTLATADMPPHYH